MKAKNRFLSLTFLLVSLLVLTNTPAVFADPRLNDQGQLAFNADGTPRRGKGRCDSYLPDWWNFKVEDYKTLCKLIKEHKA